MTYTFASLRITAIILGVVYLASHLPAALWPARAAVVARRLSHNYPLGVILMLLATVWFVVLTALMDLGEISNIRMQLMGVWTVAGVLLAIFVRGFLTLRALGCLLLLAAALMLDAAFLTQTAWRYVVTLLAYGWVVLGMILVYSPHIGRKWLDWASETTEKMRVLAWPGVALGLILIALGIWVYPS